MSAVPKWKTTADSIQLARWKHEAQRWKAEAEAERQKASTWWRQLKAAGLDPVTPDPPEGKVFPSGGVLRDQGMDELYRKPTLNLTDPEGP